MSNYKHRHQVKKITEDRKNKVILQIGMNIRTKDHDLIERFKKVTGSTYLERLRNLLDRWEDR
jgi:hypothetical protein